MGKFWSNHDEMVRTIQPSLIMNKTSDTEFKKVTGQVFDPSKDARANNVFNNINISDDIAYKEEKPLNELIHGSRAAIASDRCDKEIKNSLRSLG